jgi:hypothetical protein
MHHQASKCLVTNSKRPGTRLEGFQDGLRPQAHELSVAADNFLSMENLQGFEGLSALEESAVRLHEIYKSLMTGGFTEDEALSLIAKMTRNSPPS